MWRYARSFPDGNDELVEAGGERKSKMGHRVSLPLKDLRAVCHSGVWFKGITRRRELYGWNETCQHKAGIACLDRIEAGPADRKTDGRNCGRDPDEFIYPSPRDQGTPRKRGNRAGKSDRVNSPSRNGPGTCRDKLAHGCLPGPGKAGTAQHAAAMHHSGWTGRDGRRQRNRAWRPVSGGIPVELKHCLLDGRNPELFYLPPSAFVTTPLAIHDGLRYSLLVYSLLHDYRFRFMMITAAALAAAISDNARPDSKGVVSDVQNQYPP